MLQLLTNQLSSLFTHSTQTEFMSDLELHNPHSVLAALETRPRDVREVQLGQGRLSAGWQQVSELAARRQVAVVQVQGRTGRGRPERSRGKSSRGASGESGRQGAGRALVRPRGGQSLEEIMRPAATADRGLWLALDCLQDPHNVGAIFRSAAFFGVRGIVLTRDRSAPMNASVYDIASGGVEYVPYCSTPNLSRALKLAQKSGLWILGTSEHAERTVQAVDRQRNWLIVVGNEEKGLRHLTQQQCDEVCSIGGGGAVKSLNVSVATGCLLALLAGDPPDQTDGQRST